MDDLFAADWNPRADKRKRAGSSSLSELDTSKDTLSATSSKKVSRKIKRKKKKKVLKLQEERLKLIPGKSDEIVEGPKTEILEEKRGDTTVTVELKRVKYQAR